MLRALSPPNPGRFVGHLLTLVAAGLSLVTNTTQAGLLAIDHFLNTTYTDGGGIEGLNGGSGFALWNSGHDNTVGFFMNASGGLTYNGVVTSGGGAYANSAASPFTNDRVVSGASSFHSNQLYFGLLLETAASPANNSTLVQVGRASSADGVVRINSENGTFQLAAADASDSLAVSTGVSITPGQTNLLIGRIDFNAGGTGGTGEQFTLYVNPTSSAEPLTADATIAASNNISIDDASTYDLYLRLFQNTAATLKVDELTFATSFSDFFATTTATPEPASWLAMVAAGLGLFACRRRRPLSPRNSTPTDRD